MATFQFTTNLGSGISLVSATASFYGLSDGTPKNLGTHPVTSSSFTMDLDTTGCTYLYAVLRVDNYDAGNGSTSVGDRNILLLSVFRNDDANVSIGERETIANTFCFARFASIDDGTTVSIAAPDREMGIMYGMRNNFIAADGTLSGVISSSPNGAETNSYAMFNFLSNLLYYSISDPTVYSNFTTLSSSGDAAGSTFEAFLNMVADPWNQVEAIYNLVSEKEQVYSPSLPEMYNEQQLQKWSPVPNQWTLTIKVNDSGAQTFMIAGPGYIAFDENDRLWVTNNTTQGTPNSSTFCVVLNPDGSPADFSPVFGGGLLGGGFGVAANADGTQIALGNYGWGPKQYNPQHGSISVIASDGTVLSPSEGYLAGLSRVQGMMYDDQGNLWITSWGTQQPMAPSNETIYDYPDLDSAIVVYLNFDGSRAPEPHEILAHDFGEKRSPYNCPFDMAFDKQGNAFVVNAGGKDPDGNKIPSSIYKFRINTGDPKRPYLEHITDWTADDYIALRQINVNDAGEVFVAAVKSAELLKFDNDLNPLDPIKDMIGSPWGIGFDNDGTMYAANFFPLHEEDPVNGEKDVQGTFGVTVFRNGDDTAAGIMTLPTGGSPVTLANGYGLYGSNGSDSYQPLSRLTGTVIDRVGNLWAINNWKPSAYVDFVEQNPGGDGLVIFVGTAAPNPGA